MRIIFKSSQCLSIFSNALCQHSDISQCPTAQAKYISPHIQNTRKNWTLTYILRFTVSCVHLLGIPHCSPNPRPSTGPLPYIHFLIRFKLPYIYSFPYLIEIMQLTICKCSN